MIETVCIRGHLEFVYQGPYGYEYVGLDVCQRRFKDGSLCASPIINTFQVPAVEATDCGIAEPHGPGAHAPAIDLEDLEDDDLLDHSEDEEPIRHLDPWALGLPTPASSWIGVGLIVLCGLSIIASIYLAAKGHWLLALLV
jgi:hypothetical protein